MNVLETTVSIRHTQVIKMRDLHWEKKKNESRLCGADGAAALLSGVFAVSSSFEAAFLLFEV